MTEVEFSTKFDGYNVIVGGKKFSFLDEMGKYFHDGAIYRIYYCKSGQYEPVFSIEVSEAVLIE